MLTYRKSESIQLEIIGFSDSDFQDTRRSTSGYVFLLAGGAISWKSVKQTLIASSTMAAEFVACFEASNQGLWLRNFVTGLRILEGIGRYTVTIILQSYTATTTGVRQSLNTLTSSSWL